MQAPSAVTVPGFPTIFLPHLNQQQSNQGGAIHSTADIKKEDTDSDIQLEQCGAVTPGPGAGRTVEVYRMKILSESQQERVQKAKKYALDQSINSILQKQSATHQQQQMQNFQVTVQRQQALALMCRIYIGSINYDVPETALRTSFSPFGPIKSLSMPFDSATQKHKGFAFVEFEVPESAALSVEQMNGVMMGGRNIKVGRPTNMPQALAIIQQLAQEAMQFYRVFVSSVHPELTDRDLQSVFEAFGRVRSVNLAPDPQRIGKHRGFGYIEYDSKQAMDDACQSMNLFDLGGQYLRVGRAVTPPSVMSLMQQPTIMGPTSLPSAAALAAATITAKIQAMEASPPNLSKVLGGASPLNGSARVSKFSATPPQGVANVPPPQVVMPTLAVTHAQLMQQQQPSHYSHSGASNGSGGAPTFGAQMLADTSRKQASEVESLDAESEGVKVKGREGRNLVMQKLMRQQEQRVLVLRNMVGVDDLDAELEREVTEECGKYGEVRRVVIYQERQGHEEDAPILVKIFVEFARGTEAEAAARSLDGRWFAGRLVRAEKYDQQMYEHDDLSG